MKKNNAFQYLIFLFIALLFLGCQKNKEQSAEEAETPTITITKTTVHTSYDGFELRLNGEPFYIKGAGLEFGNIPKLAEHGGNSFRTWTTNNGKRTGREVLDEAHKYGLFVTMGLPVASERHGFNYDDKAAVKEQLEMIRGEVEALKDHPSLIIWAIGNELNLFATNPNVWNAVNEIGRAHV